LSRFEKIEIGAARLRAAGLDNPQREARWLMESLGDAVGTDTAFKLFDAMIARRQAREPLQHIIGTVEFYGLELLCDARALIPRPDSETIVEASLQNLPESYSGEVADLGTGTGCLLLAILSQRPGARGVGIEASPDAAALARENAEKTGLSERAEIINASWEDWHGWQTCDLITSNPPYIASSIVETLEPEVRDHDPLSALDGGTDGLDAYRSIFACGRKMKEGAHLVLEIGYDQSKSVPQLAEGSAFELQLLSHDLGGNPRALTFVRTSAE